VLQSNPVADSAQVISKVQVPGGLHAGEDAFH
jgi:hypothetical protein